MVMAEIAYLAEKRKIETNLEEARKYCLTHQFRVEPITLKIIEKAFEISDNPELHDRIIAAIALSKKLKLITNDPVISSSHFVETVW